MARKKKQCETKVIPIEERKFQKQGQQKFLWCPSDEDARLLTKNKEMQQQLKMLHTCFANIATDTTGNVVVFHNLKICPLGKKTPKLELDRVEIMMTYENISSNRFIV